MPYEWSTIEKLMDIARDEMYVQRSHGVLVGQVYVHANGVHLCRAWDYTQGRGRQSIGVGDSARLAGERAYQYMRDTCL